MQARLNLGCGPVTPPGWINVDRTPAPGVTLCCDAADGLALAGGSVRYAVAMHLLQDLPYDRILPALRELRRVLAPGGVARIGVPDLERAIDAYRSRDARYFHVPDAHAAAIGAKLVTQLVWYGSVRTPFTYDFAAEMLARAGFARWRRCAYRTSGAADRDIVALDNRERETLFVEAAR